MEGSRGGQLGPAASRRAVGAVASRRAARAVASRRVARASGVVEGNRGSGIVVVSARGNGIKAAGGRGIEEAEPSRAGRWPVVSGAGQAWARGV
jgi:hypothetical protein